MGCCLIIAHKLPRIGRMFLLLLTPEYLFRLGVSLRRLFCFITYHATSFMATSVNKWMLFSVVVLWNVSRLGKYTTAVSQRQDGVRNTMHIPCFIPCILLHEYDVHLIFKDWIYPFFNSNIYDFSNNCNTFLHNNNYVGDFQGHVIGLCNPFVVTNLLRLCTHS
jgi:hypothetical protein